MLLAWLLIEIRSAKDPINIPQGGSVIGLRLIKILLDHVWFCSFIPFDDIFSLYEIIAIKKLKVVD